MSTQFASIDEALVWLDSHIDYERVAPTRRLLPTLDGMRGALELLGSPEDAYAAIHVTGTNGKGSTTAMITSLLVEAGLSVGTYTSPNLHTVNERIAVNREPISDEALSDLLERLVLVEDALPERLTRFELLTVAAFAHFADEAVDVAVVEVGMGGTWDSTNVIDGVVSVITTVSLDHVAVLGSSPEEIAADKSGIIKPGSLAVIGEVSASVAEVIERRADEVGAAGLWRGGVEFDAVENRLALGGRLVDVAVPGGLLEEVLVPLHGPHQGRNAAVAIAAVTGFLGRPPSDEVVEAAMADVSVPGRLEVLGHLPLVVVDGAHNAAGALALRDALREGFHVAGTGVAVLGMLQGRDPLDLLEPLAEAGIQRVICVEPETPRAMEAALIAKAARGLEMEASVAASINEGVEEALALAGGDGMVLATGSLYVVGTARLRLLELLGSER